MNSFLGLIKKEMIVSKNWILTWLITLTLILTSFLILALRNDTHAGIIYYIILIAFFGMHFFFIPLSMYSFLHVEGKTMLWLYNPNSSNKLLLAKLLVSTIYLVISIVVIGIFTLISLAMFGKPNLETSFSPSLVFYGIAYFFISSLSVAILVTFLWTVYHSLSKFPRLKRVRWLAVILVFIGLNLIDYFLFEHTQLIKNHLFNITFEMNSQIYFEIEGEKFNVDSIPFHVGTELYHLIKTVLLYIISCVLLDKKVEV